MLSLRRHCVSLARKREFGCPAYSPNLKRTGALHHRTPPILQLCIEGQCGTAGLHHGEAEPTVAPQASRRSCSDDAGSASWVSAFEPKSAEANFAGHEAEGAMPVKFRLHLLNLERTHMHMSIRMPEVPQCHVYSAVFAALSRLGKWRSSSTMAFSCGAVCLSASSSTIPPPT